MPRVTALRERSGRVWIELDGVPWRVLPTEVVVRAGLASGAELDRAAARTLARERRRHEGLGVASRALRTRDLSARRLSDLLARRRIAPATSSAVLATLHRAGIVDDGRFAGSRTRALAERNLGDAAIRSALEREGLDRDLVQAELGKLAPESERAGGIAASRGRTPSCARYLSRKGFSEESIETALGEIAHGGVGGLE